MATKSTVPKKVRSACRRCRTRRIKCDGQVPACSNCAKSGEACIDVDSQNSDAFIPRNFVRAAKSRIQWLEAIIRDRLPDIDLTSGPRIAVSLRSIPGNITEEPEDISSDTFAEDTDIRRVSASNQPERNQSRKRLADETSSTDNEETFPEGTHSVAFNLGMLSLNSDSSQKHYLGSSSGLLFANILGASPSSEASGTLATQDSFVPTQYQHSSQTVQANLQTGYWSLHQLLRRELPKHGDGILLLQTYLRELHPDYPALEPCSLFSALEALYTCSSCSIDNDPLVHGWPKSLGEFYWNGQCVRSDFPTNDDVPMPIVAFIFFMIFNVAAIVKVRMRVYEYSPEKYYRTALAFSGDCFARTSIPSIQALIMLMVHSLLTPAETNLWTLIHVGMAHCVELGLHREPSRSSQEDPTLRQIRRYIFYVIYALDRSVSTIQGRPLGLRDEAFDVRIPDEELIGGSISNTSVSPTFLAEIVQYSKHQFGLDRIISDIKTHLYHLPIDSMQFPWPENPADHQDRINRVLQTWWSNTSRNIHSLPGIDAHHKQLWNLKMKIRYNTATILLYQPSQVARQPSDSALQTCYNSACDILQSYQLLQDWHCLQYDWRAVQSVFAAGATIIYTFWSSKNVQQKASIIDLPRALRSCSSLLSIGGEWWPSVRKGKSSFETVVDLTIHKLYTNGTSSKQPRLDLQRQKGRTLPNPDTPSSNFRLHNSGGISLSHRVPQYSPSGVGVILSQQSQAEIQPWSVSQSTTDLPTLQTEPSELISIPEPSPEVRDSLGIFPEVQDFLADFDNADFSWNMPLYDFDDQDMGLFFGVSNFVLQSGGETEQSDPAV